MIRTILFLGIVITGLGLAWSQLVFRDSPQQILSDTQIYQTVGEKLYDLKELIQITTAKMGVIDITADEPSKGVSEETAEPEEEIDRTLLTPNNIIYFTNQERKKLGLPPLAWDAKLSRSAAAKSRDMFAYDYFDHESPHDSAKDFAYFIGKQGYPYARASENLAMGGFDTAEQVVTAWMASPGHRANIVFRNYQHVGVSVQHGRLDGQEVTIIVQHFGLSKTVCPTVPTSSKEKLKDVQDRAMQFKEAAGEIEKQITGTKHLTDEQMDVLISLYNSTITSYNELATQFKELATAYNQAVDEYDKCIRKLD